MSDYDLTRAEIDMLRTDLKEQHNCIGRVWTALGDFRDQNGMYQWDHVASLKAERDALRRFALHAFRVGEWLAGEGFVGRPGEHCPEDPDELFLDLVKFLGVETDEEAVKALEGMR